MPASSDKVIRSPRLAAMGVATLSGLMPTFLDATITPIMMRPEDSIRTWKANAKFRLYETFKAELSDAKKSALKDG